MQSSKETKTQLKKKFWLVQTKVDGNIIKINGVLQCAEEAYEALYDVMNFLIDNPESLITGDTHVEYFDPTSYTYVRIEMIPVILNEVTL